MIFRFGFRYAVNRTEFGERAQVKKQGCAPCPKNIVQHCVGPALPNFFYTAVSRPALEKMLSCSASKTLAKPPGRGQAQGKGAYNIKMVAKSFGKICLRAFSKKIVFSPKIITRIKFPFLDKQ